MLRACRAPFSEGEEMREIMSVCSSGLCDRVIDFIDLIEKWRRGYVCIGNVRVGCCRRLEPLVEFLVMGVWGVF